MTTKPRKPPSGGSGITPPTEREAWDRLAEMHRSSLTDLLVKVIEMTATSIVHGPSHAQIHQLQEAAEALVEACKSYGSVAYQTERMAEKEARNAADHAGD